MTLLSALLGALIGAAIGDASGLVAGLVVGVLAGRQWVLQRKLAALVARVDALQDDPADAVPAPAAEPAPTVSSANAWDEAVPGAFESATTRAVARFNTAWSRAIAFFTTGNVIARIGVVVLFFGVAFLVRLAAEHGLVPIELRLVGIALGALALIAIGWRFRQRRRDWALVVQGGGVGVLYLTVFAATRLYDLVPMGLAFALMVSLVVASAALAVLQNAPSLAALGIAGGFLAPVLTSTGAGSHVALFSYYALLNAGILSIAWFRAWRALNLLGFAFTWIIGALWGARFYRPEYFASVEPFVVLSFVFYLALPVLYAERQKPALRGLVDGTLVFGNPLVFFTIQNRLVDDIAFGRAYSALVLGLVYVLLARALWRRDAAGMRLLAEAFLALGALFATLAIPFAVDGHWTAAAWSLEGAGMVWVGLRQRRRLAQVAGLALEIGAAGMFFLQAPLRFGPAPPVDQTALGAALIALAGFFTAWRFARDGERAPALLRRVEPGLLIWAVAWWCGALALEIDRVVAVEAFRSYYATALVLSAITLAWFARRLAWPWAAWPPAAALPAAAALAGLQFLRDVRAAPWADGGWLAWPLLVAGGYLLLARYAWRWPTRVVDALHTGMLLLVVFFMTWISAHGVAAIAVLDGAWVLATCGAVSTLLLIALATVARSARWPFDASPTAYRSAGPVLLLALLAAWLVTNLGDDGHAAPLGYVPLINPLDIVAIAALLAAVWWWRRSGRRRHAADAHAAVVVVGMAAFLVLNTVILRAMHHYTAVPYTAHALWHAPAVQAALALAWAVLGSFGMALAARRSRVRGHWLIGAALLGLVVVKLFLVDLAGSGAVARIVSFIGVGLVCLVIGYFAPIPPRIALLRQAA